MTTPLTFYTNPMSRGRIVRWMLEELAVPYETVMLDYGTSMKASEYLAINPMGKVPAIKLGQSVVTECGAICMFLADAFPQARLAPSIGSPDRAAYLRWMFFAAGPVEAATTVRGLGVEVAMEKSGMVGWGSDEAVSDRLDELIGSNAFLLGDEFSALDVYLGAQLGWAMQFGSLPVRDSFGPYLERIMARPAAVRAREIDDALIKP
jgi:glutathione S-transferase